MEERIPPSTATTDHRLFHHNDYNNNTTRPTQTYIVQIPKDQVYRVPPPEHARIVERYRNPDTNKRRCTPCMFWCLSTLITLTALITTIICVYHFTLNPKPPTFSVERLVVKRAKKNGPSQFRISMGTANPNGGNDIGYSEGCTTLTYNDDEVAVGNFPALDKVEAGKNNGDVGVVLEGSGLPEKPKSPVDLELTMSISVKMITWLFTKKKEVKVECKFSVNSLGDNAKVLSQKCEIQD